MCFLFPQVHLDTIFKVGSGMERKALRLLREVEERLRFLPGAECLERNGTAKFHLQMH